LIVLPIQSRYWLSGPSFFAVPSAVKLFKESLLQVLEVERQRSLTNRVSSATDIIPIPALYTPSFSRQKSLDKFWLRRAILLGMHADRKCFLLDLRRLNVGFEMNPALILVMPIDLVELQVNTTVVYGPPMLEPTGMPQLFLKVTEDILYIFHSVSPNFLRAT